MIFIRHFMDSFQTLCRAILSINPGTKRPKWKCLVDEKADRKMAVCRRKEMANHRSWLRFSTIGTKNRKNPGHASVCQEFCMTEVIWKKLFSKKIVCVSLQALLQAFGLFLQFQLMRRILIYMMSLLRVSAGWLGVSSDNLSSIERVHSVWNSPKKSHFGYINIWHFLAFLAIFQKCHLVTLSDLYSCISKNSWF